jgi:hypothetical protein
MPSAGHRAEHPRHGEGACPISPVAVHQLACGRTITAHRRLAAGTVWYTRSTGGRSPGQAGPDPHHPFSHGAVRFFTAFLVAVVMFTLGSLFSLYEGYQKLLHPITSQTVDLPLSETCHPAATPTPTAGAQIQHSDRRYNLYSP